MSLQENLKNKRFIVTSEIQPPIGTGVQDLIRASESGVENILAFTEDYRITGDSLQEIMFFHVDSGKLFSVIENLRGGHDILGKEISVKPNFCVGSGFYSGCG